MKKDLILAFDPGRDKIGFAVVNFDGELIFSGIFTSDKKEIFFDMLLNEKNFDEFLIEKFSESFNFFPFIKFIIIGNGTKSKDFYNYAKNTLPFEIKIIDEKNLNFTYRNSIYITSNITMTKY